MIASTPTRRSVADIPFADGFKASQKPPQTPPDDVSGNADTVASNAEENAAQPQTTIRRGAPAFVDLTDENKPKATIENFKALLHYQGITVRFNELSRRCEIAVPGMVSTVDNAEEIAIAALYSAAARYSLAAITVDRFLLTVADSSAYNPFRNYVLSTPWDGVKRFESLAACLVTNTPDIAALGLRKTLLGVIAGNFNPLGVGDPPPVLTLTGGQGCGKTTFFRRLIPATVERGFLEGVTLDPGNKDSVIECTTHALVELGEIDATFRKADIAKLKAFLTRHKDTYREPYGKRDITRSRKSVYVASVNDDRFLVDTTGNRRFLAVAVTDVQMFSGDIQQIWAEIHAAWLAGEGHALTRGETQQIERHNAAFVQHDEVVDSLARLNWQKYEPSQKGQYLTATDAAILVGFISPDKYIINRVAAQVRKLQVIHGVPESLRKDRKDRYWLPG